ncbi:restriction endonuclease [Stenotrophomonas pavanii]|uniref:Restriction endonuclease n=1 Tax=Stenotrophomonas pavanii TaxID=487698 RepID=A0A246KWE9_9GAMM|nr:restriction endonuclease [Stenotrophomonas pavanii]
MIHTSVRVKFICRLGYGDSLPKDEEFAGDTPVFGSNGQYTTTCARNTEIPAIVLGRKGSYGKVNWAPDGCFASDTTFFIDVRLTGANLRWLYWSLQTLGLDEGSQEAAVPGLNRESVYEERIWLPSLTNQSNIANFLDRETARIDGLIAEKRRMLALLEEKRVALISRVVTRGLDPDAPLRPSGQEWLGDIPAHWGLQRLKQLAEVRGGLTLGKQYSGKLLEYPYLRVANVQDGYLKLDEVLTVEVPAKEAASNLLAYGDVLMNEGGDIDKLGRGCVWRNEIAPCLHQNHVFAVRPHSVDSDWLALWTSTLQAKCYFESRAKRSTNLASISGSNIKELPVPLPPVSEQLAIRHFLAVRHTRLETLRGELRDSLRLLVERRAALITAAVTGQIPPEEMTG